MNHVTWAEVSPHEACINQGFPDHLTLQNSTPPMMVAFECHRLESFALEDVATPTFPTVFSAKILAALEPKLR